MAKRKNNLNKASTTENARIKQLVKSMVNKPVEIKYFDQFTSQQPTEAGTLTNISDIVRGTEVTNRIGNQVTFKHFSIRMKLELHPSVNYGQIRVLLMVDKQGYNAPVVTDVLEPAYVGTNYTPIAKYHWDYRKRFDIFYDTVFDMVKNGPGHVIFQEFNKKLNINSQFIGASTTFVNQIYILIIGAEPNVLQLSTFSFYSRLEFVDA